MSFNYNIQGLKQVRDALNNFEAKITTAAERGLLKALLFCEKEAKNRCPVVTGRLRASITGKITKFTGTAVEGKLGAHTNYAAYVELGTARSKARPYLWPALEDNFEKIEKILASELGKETK